MEGLETINLTPPSCYNLVNCTTGQVDYVLNGTSNGVDLFANLNNYVGQVIIGTTTIYGCWNIQIGYNCEGYRSDVGIAQLSSSADAINYCGCPNGYTYNEVSGLCELVESANQPAITFDALSADITGLLNSNYSNLGAVIYDDITNAIFPIIATPQPSNPIVQSCNTIIPPATTPHPLVITSLPSPWPPITPPIPTSGPSFNKAFRENTGTGNVILPVAAVLNSAWYTPDPSPPPLATYTWLTKYGINITEPGVPSIPGNIPVRTWVGFNTCLTITTETEYCLAMAADNAVRVFINGDLKIELNIGNSEVFNSSYVHVFPITLQPGVYQFRVEGLNYSSAGAFGAALYDVDPVTLATYTTSAQLDAVKIFVTSDLVGQPFQTSSNSTYGYTCNVGVLNTCDGYQCISTAPYRPCCYQLVTCDGVVEYQINYNDIQQTGIPAPGDIVAPQVISSITFFINRNPVTINGCWTIQPSQCDPLLPNYNWEDAQAINLLQDCATCQPTCVRLTDCSGEQDSIIVKFPDLSSYIGKTIKFKITTPVTNGWSAGTYCATVAFEDECEDAIALNIDGTITQFNTCTECNPPCYLLTDCSNPSNTIVLSGDLSQYIGGVITLLGCDDICWIVSLADSCDGSVPAPPVGNFYPSVGNLGNKCCYRYRKPSSFNGSITINGNVITLYSTNLIDLVNEITDLGFGTCTISDPGDLSGFGAVICIVGNNTYGPLTYNAGANTASQYCEYNSVLRQCNYTSYNLFIGINIFIKVTINGIQYNSIATPTITGFEIVDYLNSLGLGIFSISFSGLTPPILATIYVEGINDYGAIVITNANTGVPITTLTIDECNNFVNTELSCQECTPPPIPPTPFTLHTRKVKPGYDTKGCPPEYTEKVLCNYAEQAFDEMAKARYGIKICCEKDFDYWDIKKQILELKALYDENVCKVQFPCKCYKLSNSNPSVPTIFNYSDCNAKYLTISVTNSDGIVKVCATNVPVGMGGTPTVVLNGLCQDEICP